MHPVAHWLVSSPWAHLAEMLLILLGALATGPRTRSRRSGLLTPNAKPGHGGTSTPATMRADSPSTLQRGRGGMLTFLQLSRTVTPTKRRRGFKRRSLNTVWITSVGGDACISPGSGAGGGRLTAKTSGCDPVNPGSSPGPLFYGDAA